MVARLLRGIRTVSSEDINPRGSDVRVQNLQARPSAEMKKDNFAVRTATVDDVPVILDLIRALATYERAPNEVTATEKGLVEVLFGEKPAAEVLLAFENEAAIGFAVFFYNFSTWLGRPGLFLKNRFVNPQLRGKGYGRPLLFPWAKMP